MSIELSQDDKESLTTFVSAYLATEHSKFPSDIQEKGKKINFKRSIEKSDISFEDFVLGCGELEEFSLCGTIGDSRNTIQDLTQQRDFGENFYEMAALVGCGLISLSNIAQSQHEFNTALNSRMVKNFKKVYKDGSQEKLLNTEILKVNYDLKEKWLRELNSSTVVDALDIIGTGMQNAEHILILDRSKEVMEEEAMAL